MAQQPTEICDNCLKPFPESKIATHFGYCRRNIKKCPNCGEMYDINFQEEHQEEFHKLSSCRHCKKQFKPNEIPRHEENCDYRTKYCEYCDLDVPFREYPSHLRDCESRTKQCEKCRKPIANKDFLIHTISCPGFVQEIKEPVNQYHDYQTYLKEQKKKEEIKRNEYKPSHQEPRRQASRGHGVRPENAYSNNIYSNNNGVRQAEIKKEVIIPNRQIVNQSKPVPNYADIKMNKNAINYGEQRIPASNIYQKDPRTKVQSNSTKNIDSNKHIGSGKVIENKYVPSVHPQKPSYQYKPTYGTSKDAPKAVIQPSTNIARTYQPPQMDVNHRPAMNGPSNNYPKGSQTYKNVPLSKQVVYGRKQEKPKQVPRNAQYPYRRQEPRRQEARRQEPRRQEPRRHQQISRNMPKTNVIPTQQYNPHQPARQYVPEQPVYQHDSGVNDQQMDEELQKAIMASLGNVAISTPKHQGSNQTKPSYKIDEVPPEFLENDMMNESFYGKQQALWAEFEKNKKRR